MLSNTEEIGENYIKYNCYYQPKEVSQEGLKGFSGPQAIDLFLFFLVNWQYLFLLLLKPITAGDLNGPIRKLRGIELLLDQMDALCNHMDLKKLHKWGDLNGLIEELMGTEILSD